MIGSRLSDIAIDLEPMMSERSDVELLQKVAQHADLDAYTELYDRHFNVAFSIAFNITGNHASAEDATQEAMLRVWKSARLFKTGSARSWILTIVAREGIRLIKAKRREQREEKEPVIQREQTSSAKDAEHGELLSALRNVLKDLPELERQLIALHFGAGLSQHQIGAALELPQPTISFRIKKALDSLRGDLSKAGFAAAVPLVSAEKLCEAMSTGYECPPGMAAILVQRIKNGDVPARMLSRRAAAARGSAWVPLTATLALALAAGALGWSMTGKVSVRDSQGPAADPPAQAPFSRTWNFNSPEQTNDFKATTGSWRFVAGGGPDGSGCMETKDEICEVELNISGLKLPVRFTVRTHMILPQPEGGYLFSPWFAYRWLAQYHNVGIKNVQNPNHLQWNEMRIYISEGFTDTWVNDQHSSFEAHDGLHGLPSLAFRGRHRIDDLSVQEIRPNELPDVHKYLDALAKIPLDKRVGTVELPELKPAQPGEKVTVTFDTGDK